MPCAAFHWAEEVKKEAVGPVGVVARKGGVVRGPWDHSGSIRIAVDVDALVARPVRAWTV